MSEEKKENLDALSMKTLHTKKNSVRPGTDIHHNNNNNVMGLGGSSDDPLYTPETGQTEKQPPREARFSARDPHLASNRRIPRGQTLCRNTFLLRLGHG